MKKLNRMAEKPIVWLFGFLLSIFMSVIVGVLIVMLFPSVNVTQTNLYDLYMGYCTRPDVHGRTLTSESLCDEFANEDITFNRDALEYCGIELGLFNTDPYEYLMTECILRNR
jgi:hypothetical protein